MPEDFSKPVPILSLSRGLTIRPLLHSDAPALAKHGNNIKISRNMTNRFPFPYTIDNAHEFIAVVRDVKKWRRLRSPSQPGKISAESIGELEDGALAPCHWAIALNGEYIGNMGFEFGSDVEEQTAQLGYWIGEEFWGKGFVTDVTRAVIPWAWQVYPEVIRLEASVYSWNPASGSVLRRIGFAEEGRRRAAVSKMGKVCDLIMFSLIREGLEIATDAPTELSS